MCIRDSSPMWPGGKKRSRNVYAKTREECEALLPGLIQQMKAEIKAIKESGNLDAIPDGISAKKKAIATYMRENPEVTSKSEMCIRDRRFPSPGRTENLPTVLVSRRLHTDLRIEFPCIRIVLHKTCLLYTSHQQETEHPPV